MAFHLGIGGRRWGTVCQDTNVWLRLVIKILLPIFHIYEDGLKR